MIIAADVHFGSLSIVQFRNDLLAVGGQLLRDRLELDLQVGASRLVGERFGPIEREIEAAAAIVQLVDSA